MTTSTPLTQTVGASGAQLRLAHSRTQIARWLEQDQQAPPALSTLVCAVGCALPLLGGLHAHPGTALVLGALARAWLRPGPPPPAKDSATCPQPLDLTIALARRHPGASLVAVGITGLALWWWSRSSNRPPPR